MDNNTLLQNLADIEQPAPPEWQGFMTLIIVAMSVLLLVSWTIWHWRAQQQKRMGTPAFHAIGMLDELMAQWSNGEINDRETTYRLTTLLRLGFRLEQINLKHPPALKENLSVDKIEWEKTIRLFSQIRYQHTTSSKLNDALFKTIKGWLNAFPEQQLPEQKSI